MNDDQVEESTVDNVRAFSGEETVTLVKGLRAELEKTKDDVLSLKNVCRNTEVPQAGGKNADIGEAIANTMLAYRHLEDAKMRLGKVIQAIEGQSVYDQPAK